MPTMPANRRPPLSDGTPLPPPQDPIEPIASLTASRNIETVRAAIKARYGDNMSNAFAEDFIAFVEALTDGQ